MLLELRGNVSAYGTRLVFSTLASLRPNNCADNGGYPSKAFDYWISTGVVGSMCKPSKTYANASNTQCVKQCDNGRSYSSVMHYGKYEPLL